MFDDRSGTAARDRARSSMRTTAIKLTAWSIDIGPGRSNVPRKAVFALDKPLEAAGGVRLTFKLAQNHGGWNSDDNQNNNLGRFRFSVTGGGECRCRSVADRRARRSCKCRPTERTPEQIGARLQLLANDGAGMARRESPDRGAVAEPSAAARRSLRSQSARRRGRRIGSSAATFSRRPKKSRPACRRSCIRSNEARVRIARQPARLRPLARRSPFADDGPVDRESHLAGVLRHRPGGDGRGLRHAGRAAVASGAAGLARGRVDGPQLEPQAHSSADRHFGDVSAIEPRDAGAAGARSGQSAAGPRAAVSRRCRDRSRHRARRPAGC